MLKLITSLTFLTYASLAKNIKFNSNDPRGQISDPNNQCLLQPVNSELNNLTTEIYTYKYNDGLHASNILSAVRHEGCSGNGACTWQFIQCDYSQAYNAAIYTLKNIKYGTHLYANIAAAMSHLSDTLDNICYVYKYYQFVVYKDPCDGQYYLYNLAYNQWVYASTLNLVTHSSCGEGQAYGHGCGDYRSMVLKGVGGVGGEQMNEFDILK